MCKELSCICNKRYCEKPHEIDSLKCIKCGKCKENCRFGAIEVL